MFSFIEVSELKVIFATKLDDFNKVIINIILITTYATKYMEKQATLN